MFSKAAVLSVVVGVVAAQSSIPSSVQQGTDCYNFLTQLNSDSSLTTCTKSLLSSTSSFDASSANSQSTSQALSSFCSSSASCSEDSIRSTLSSFYSKCSSQLAGGADKDVTLIYDTLYALIPYKEAICAKGDDGNYCATSASAQSTVPLTSGGSVPAQQVLQTLGNTAPNATTFANTNILFLFLNPSTSNLCSACTRNVISAYMDFESKISYGPGFSGSVLLKGQSDLYSAITSQCGSSFLEGKLQAAGSLSGGVIGQGNGASSQMIVSGGIAALAAVFTAIAASAF